MKTFRHPDASPAGLRPWLAAAAFVLQALAPAGPASAQEFPAAPIKIVVGYPAGGSTDSVARVLAQGLQERLGKTVIVDNRPGASTQIAGEAVMRAAPDGYTLHMAASDLTILPSVRKRAPWNPATDFTPIARIATAGLVYSVKNKLPVNSLGEFVALAKAQPGTVTYGSGGTGSILHLTGEQLRSRAGVDLVHVPYRGGAPIVQGLMSGEIDMGVLGPIDVASRMDKVRAIAQTGATRHPLLPQVPTAAEAGFPQISAISMFTLVGPANLPRPVVDRLVREIAALFERPDFQQRVVAAGSEPAFLAGPALERFLADDLKNWRDVARASKILLDE